MNQQIGAIEARTCQPFRAGLIDAELALTSLQTAWEKTRRNVFTEAYRRYNKMKCINARHVWRRILADYNESEAGGWATIPPYVAAEYANLLVQAV